MLTYDDPNSCCTIRKFGDDVLKIFKQASQCSICKKIIWFDGDKYSFCPYCGRRVSGTIYEKMKEAEGD